MKPTEKSRKALIGPRSLAVIAAGVVVVLVLGFLCFRAIADLREERALTEELRQIRPSFGARIVAAQASHDVKLFNRELQGWMASRVPMGCLLQQLAKDRPPSFEPTRLVVQEQWVEQRAGSRELGYHPRARKFSAVMSSTVRGAQASMDVASFIGAVSATNSLGAVFSRIRSRGMERVPAAPGDPVCYTTSIEAYTAERPVDLRRTP
jgi:hypothetical protein